MDLGAYVQIDELEKIAKDNGIEVPRLRGYRLMKDEKPIDYRNMFDGIDIKRTEDLCESIPFWSSNAYAHEFSNTTNYIKRIFIQYKNGKPIRVRWERIHGWKRRVLKLAIHNYKKRIKTQYEVWNKYAGRDDILYIHSRIGGGNWYYYYNDVVDKPWFVEKVDDYFDSTYCDIYARIKKEENESG